MQQTKKIAPVNSLVFVSDSGGGKAPIPVWGAHILATPSCISIACYPEIEGETEIVLGRADSVHLKAQADFDQLIDTSRRDLVVSTVDQKTVLKTAVPTSKTRIRIWRSHPEWPEKIIIGWG